MKISVEWLKDFFPNSKDNNLLDSRLDFIKEKLPLAGLELCVETGGGAEIRGVLTAEVASLEKHPNADRLNLCQVNVGSGDLLQVICGASNVRQGLKIAFAPIGCELPGGLKIKRAKMRGVESFGMICSEAELGMSAEADGILELPDDTKIGLSLSDALDLNAETWDVELTPDRADCLSHLGIAREVGRLIGKRAQLPELDDLNPDDSSSIPLINLEVKDAKACPLYGLQTFEGFADGKGQCPDWLPKRLEQIGMNTHSPIVDVTNYVLMELGHPMHAFDADKIAGSKIIVRFAKKGEKLITIDEQELELCKEDLIIADTEKPLALAGVMGGLESAVDENTTRIALETAIFDEDLVRASSHHHKLHTDSSHRFERGVDAANCIRAAGRAGMLLRRVAGGRRRGSYLEQKSDDIAARMDHRKINFDLRTYREVIGVDIEAHEVISALSSVGIETHEKSANVLSVHIPSYRLDLQREIDLVEETARLIGFERIPEHYPKQKAYTKTKTLPLYEKTRKIRKTFLEMGLAEMMPYNFCADSELEYLADPKMATVELEKPLTQDWKHMRPNASLGLLKILTRQAALRQFDVSVFDLGRVFRGADAGKDKYGIPSMESLHVAWAHMGQRNLQQWFSDKKSAESSANVDYFDAKGIAEKALHHLAVLEGRWTASQFVPLNSIDEATLAKVAPWIPAKLLHPGRSALIVWPAKKNPVVKGYIGELHPAYKNDLLNLPAHLKTGAVLGELCIEEGLFGKDAQYEYTLNSRGKIARTALTPIVERDLALVIEKDKEAGKLVKSLTKAAGKHLVELNCVDRYPLEDGKVSLAFRVKLQDPEKTLSEKEIQSIVDEMLSLSKKEIGATLRA